MSMYYVYLILLPVISLICGYYLGKRQGWMKRDNQANLDLIKIEIEDLAKKCKQVSVGWWVSTSTQDVKPTYTQGDQRPQLSLEQQLQNALDKEDFEMAAEIRDKLNKKNEGNT